MNSASYSYSSTHSFKYTTLSKITNGMIFANDVSYENGKFILKDKYIKDENFEQNRENILQHYHYTCLKTRKWR